ncbi:M42 family metallopeptidase [Proteinivorax hydrogeniformans]|uniref:M42 family metallopeptidase n=1 Tax=Proteinivorax hydrogeniformans TaxID=1826727 RepID=A0AAU8HP68_9FIRM
MNTKAILKELTETTGVSGYELDVAIKVDKHIKNLCDEVNMDRLGNVIGKKSGEGKNRPKVMLAAHMDEIGLMVTEIDDDGFIRFTSVGGIDPRTLPSQEVTVYGAEEVFGIIGAKPPHLTHPSERGKAIDMYDLFIDTGLSGGEVKKKVRVGDIAVVNRELTDLLSDRVAGKAIDDRAGVCVMIECLRQLQRIKHQCDVYTVATVQEEVGIRGAMVSTYGIVPDIGIAIDVSFGDMPGVDPQNSSKLGAGPALAIGPNIHPNILKKLKEVAAEWGISFQIETEPMQSGTDASAMQITRGGIATALVSLPQRYMHTSVESVSLKDIKNAGKLLAMFISLIDYKDVEGLKCF